MRFFIKYSLIAVLAGVITALYFLCCTTEGLVMDLHYITLLFPGKLEIKKISGTLFSGFSLETLTYQTKEEKIALKSMRFNWDPKQLLQLKLAVNTLELEQPELTFFPATSSTADIPLNDFKFLNYITINRLAIHQLSVKEGDMRFDLTGELNQRWRFSWKFVIPKLHALCASCSGSLEGFGSLAGEPSAPLIYAHLNGRQLEINQQKISALSGEARIVVQSKINSTIHLAATHLKINDNFIKKIAVTLTGNIAYEKKNLLAQAQIAFKQKPFLFLNATLPHFTHLVNPDQKINAIIRLNMTELEGLRYFIPKIRHPRGILQGKIEANGTISRPFLRGMLNLSRGHVLIQELGIHLNDITLQAAFDKSNFISLQGSLRSGHGKGQLHGSIDLTKPNFPLELTLQGKDLNAVHLHKFKIVISPDLKLNFIYPTLALQGKIFIPSARIKLKNVINIETLPDETVFVGEARAETPPFLLAAKLHLAVDLGNDVFFSYKDFETYLGGKLLIDQAPATPATATGEIVAIKGKYTIYGQNLVIKTGRLIFAGNVLTNPGLHIEAIRKVKNINTSNPADTTGMPSLENYTGTDTTVGVRIIGTVNNPQITLFSIPTGLTKAQILSSLGAEGAALMGALSVLGPETSKMGGVTDKLTKMLGLTEMNITSVQTFNSATNQMQSTPSLVVGKQLSKKLSLHYSIGIFNPVSILNVRYQFNKHWAVQSETSTIDNGADILYGFERP